VGLLVDHTDKRRTMIFTCLLRGLIVVFFIFCQSPESLPALYIIIFLKYTVNSVYVPARTAMVPGVVPKADLLVANGLDGVVWSSMIFIGGAMGGFATSVVGITGAFILDALTYVVAAYVIALLRTDIDSKKDNPSPLEDGETPGLLSPFRDLGHTLMGLPAACRGSCVTFLAYSRRLRRRPTPATGRISRQERQESAKTLMTVDVDEQQLEDTDGDRQEDVDREDMANLSPATKPPRLPEKPEEATSGGAFSCKHLWQVYSQVFKYLVDTPYVFFCLFLKFSIWIVSHHLLSFALSLSHTHTSCFVLLLLFFSGAYWDY